MAIVPMTEIIGASIRRAKTVEVTCDWPSGASICSAAEVEEVNIEYSASDMIIELLLDAAGKADGEEKCPEFLRIRIPLIPAMEIPHTMYHLHEFEGDQFQAGPSNIWSGRSARLVFDEGDDDDD